MKKATRRIRGAPTEVGLKTSESQSHDSVTVDFGDGHSTNVDEVMGETIVDAQQEHNQAHDIANNTGVRSLSQSINKLSMIVKTVAKLRGKG